jgi:hypothetical protein
MFVGLFVFLLLAGSDLDPCACETPSFDLAWKSSTAVFSGRLIQAQKSVEGKQELAFQVTDSWKGSTPLQATVLYENPSSCATTVFVVGKEYVVYAWGDKPLHVSHCTRTKPRSSATDDLALLRQEQGPPPAAPRDPFITLQGDKPANWQTSKRIPRTLSINFAVILAISHKGDEYLAVLKGSDGKTYTMRKGDAVYDGTIENIAANTVTFRYRSGGRVTKKLHPFPE